MLTWNHRLPLLFAVLMAIGLWLRPAGTIMAADAFPTPERPIHNGIDQVQVELNQLSNQGFNARIIFPQPQLWTVKQGDIDYVQLAIPGMEQGYGPVGLPAIPFYSRLVAVPEGATAEIADIQVTPRSQLIAGVIYPTQPEPLDTAQAAVEGDGDSDEFSDLPFASNQEYYSGTQVYPQPVATIERLGRVRYLNLYRISIATGRYDPASQRIQLFESVGVKVRFEGGEGYYSTRRDNLAFNDHIIGIKKMTINYDDIEVHVDPGLGGPFVCIGTELLIITDPAFRAAADDLELWKEAKGISTSVVETGIGVGQAGTTSGDIRQFIRNRYNNCLIQLSYVLLLGDAEFVPPFYRLAPDTGDLAGTDLDYALMDNPDILPDLAVGRIPVDTLIQAQDVVSKSIDYEQSPPNVGSFYDNATVASYFQCCRNEATLDEGTDTRSFVETSELVRDELMGEGYTVTRIYTTDTDRSDDPTDPDTYYTGDPTPDWYYNSARLPVDLRASSGFAWDGDTNDVIDAFNAGNFLIIHRDHGSISSWGSPSFTTSNQNSLTNGNLTPIVYSINCTSGLFDNETRNPANDVKTYNTTPTGVYFSENLLRIPDGGAVGIIGDVRNSPTWANSALLRGLVDATWPGTVPGNGNAGTSLTRLGDILNYGKLYLEGQVGVAQTAGSVTSTSADHDVIIYNVYGDPTLEMWTNDPYPFHLSGTYTMTHIGPHTWQFRYADEGVTITAMQQGRPLAQGAVENGVANLLFIGRREPNVPVDFIADRADTLPVHLKNRQTSNVVTKETGGTLDVSGALTATFHSDAVTKTVEIIHTELFTPTAPLPTGEKVLRSFQLEAEDADGNEVDHFEQPFELEVCNTDTSQSVDRWKDAVLNYFDESAGTWMPLPTHFDPASGCISSELDHFTEFSVFEKLVSEKNFLYMPSLSN